MFFDHLTNAEVPRSGAETETETVDEGEARIRWESDDAIVKQYIDAFVPNKSL